MRTTLFCIVMFALAPWVAGASSYLSDTPPSVKDTIATHIDSFFTSLFSFSPKETYTKVGESFTKGVDTTLTNIPQALGVAIDSTTGELIYLLAQENTTQLGAASLSETAVSFFCFVNNTLGLNTCKEEETPVTPTPTPTTFVPVEERIKETTPPTPSTSAGQVPQKKTSSAPTPLPPQAPTRVVERVVTPEYITIEANNTDLLSRISFLESSLALLTTKLNTLPTQTATTFTGYGTYSSYQPPSTPVWGLTQKIDNLPTGVTIPSPTISNPTVTGGSLASVSLSSPTITNLTIVGTTTLSGFTSGSVLFANSLGQVSQDNASFFFDETNNRLGLGTTSPFTTLSVSGDASVTGSLFLASSTPLATTNRLYNNASSLYWNGALVAGATVGNWTLSGGNVYRATGNVGVGTSSPTEKLHVYGDAVAPSQRILVETANSGAEAAVVLKNPSQQWQWYIPAGTTRLDLYGTSVATVMSVLNTGSVGIGTTSPWAKLSIKGSGTGTGKAFAVSDSSNVTRVVINDNGNVGIGTTTPQSLLSLYKSGAATYLTIDADVAQQSALEFKKGNVQKWVLYDPISSNDLRLYDGTEDRVTFKNGGNVGIGTTNPGSKLEVNGDIKLSSTGATLQAGDANHQITFGDTTVFTTWHNFKFDKNNGGATTIMTVGTVGSSNVGIGTTTPTAPLHVSGASGYSIAKFKSQFSVSGVIASDNSQVFFGHDSGSDGTWSNGMAAISSGGVFFNSGGSERMRITSAGSVGIGTTSPWAKLSIKGSGTSTGKAFAVSDSSNVTRFVINDNGNVGIGTASPSSLLHLSAGSSGATAIANAQLILEASGSRYIQFALPTASTGGIFFGDSSDNDRGGITYQNSTAAGLPDTMTFVTNGNARAVINSTGNVGIGTTTPAYKLDVFSNTSASAARFTSSNDGGGVGLRVDTTDTNHGVITADFDTLGNPTLTVDSAGGTIGYFQMRESGTQVIRLGQTFSGGQVLATKSNLQVAIDADNDGTGAFEIAKGSWNGRVGSDGTSLFRVTNAGNVGIGTTNPGAKLSVAAPSGSNVVDFALYNDAGSTQILKLSSNSGAVASVTSYGDMNLVTQNSGVLYLKPNGSSMLSLNPVTGNSSFTGSVGIGITTPLDSLHLFKNEPGIILEDDGWGAGTGGMWRMRPANNDGRFKIERNTSSARDFATYVEDLVITTAGNVGIGTTAPLSQLQIKNATNQETQIGGTAGIYTNSTYFTDLFRLDSAINFSRSSDGAFLNSIFGYETTALAENNLGLVARHDIKFVVGATADRGMIIKSGGNVGIGTTAPGNDLHISGTESIIRLQATAVSGKSWDIVSGGGGAHTAGVFALQDTTGGTTPFKIINPTANDVLAVVGSSVGIGTSNPGVKLEVNGGSSIAAIRLATSALTNGFDIGYLNGTSDPALYLFNRENGAMILSTNATERMRITSGGNVGIGTTNPGQRLQVGAGVVSDFSEANIFDTATEAISIVGDAGGEDAALVLGVTDGTRNSRAKFFISDQKEWGLWQTWSSGGDQDFVLGMGAGGERLRVTSGGSVGIGTSTPTTGKFVIAAGHNANALVLENVAVGKYWSVYNYTNSSATDLRFYEQNSGGNSLTLQAGGNVGIGTVNPTAKLTVVGGNVRVDTNQGVEFGGANNFIYGNETSDFIALVTNNTEAMRMLSNGYVGIGTTSPSQKLDVAGIIAVSGQAALWSDSSYIYVGDIAGGDGYRSLVLRSNDTEQMRITTAGNIGIGTTTPTATSNNRALSIYGTWTSSIDLGGNGAYRHLTLSTDGSGNGYLTANSAKSLYLGSDNATRITLHANGNVGIGTTVPQSRLEVIGAGSDQEALTLRNVSGGGKLALGARTTTGEAFLQGLTNGGSANALLLNPNGGNVGIGTTTPTSGKLVIAGSDDLVALAVTNTSAMTASFELGQTLQGGNSIPYLRTLRGGDNASFRIYAGGTALSGTPALTVRYNGNIGIGTTTPGAKLQVNYDGGATAALISETVASFSNTSATTDNAYISIQSGNAAEAAIVFGDTDDDNRGYLRYVNGATDYFSIAVAGEKVRVQQDGNVGIGTTTPWRTLSVTGTVGFDGLTGSTGAGSLCLSSSKQVVYNSASDSCLPSLRETKHDIAALALSATEVLSTIEPVSFIYNESDGRVRYGFIAEDVAAVDPHLATYNASSTISGIDDRAMVSLLVKGFKEVWNEVVMVKNSVVAVTSRVDEHDREIAELKARIAALESTQAPEEGEEETPTDTTPPTITITGNNPAQLTVGDSYADLGAIAIDDSGTAILRTYVRGIEVTAVSIDTSVAGEHAVVYVATDLAGNSATSTRAVVVEEVILP